MCGDSGEITNHEPQTRCQKLLVRIQALIFSALSIYTIISLILALEQVSRTDLQLSDTPPSDRCVPFFDKVKQYKEDHNNTYTLYDYRTGEAIVRICTNETSAAVRSAIGAQFAYDPWVADTGCDVLGADKQRFIDNCELAYTPQVGDPSTCEEVLNVTPMPYGAHWNMYMQIIGPNKTNTTYNGPAPRCSIRVNIIRSISPCNLVTMEPMHEENTNAAALIKFGIAVPFIVMLLQCWALHSYAKNEWKAAEGWKLAFALRGAPGALYQLYWVCHEGDNGRGEFPDVFLNLYGWFACLVQDAMEGLVVPLVAILGCRLDRYPVNAILVVLKAIKILMKNRNEESEPGGESEQRQCWAESAARMSKADQQMKPQPNVLQAPPPQAVYPGQQQPGFYPTQQPQYQGGV
jgi:hypothetical protein